MRCHMNRFTKQFHICSPLDQCSSKSTDRLISYKKNRILLIPQIMFQMVLDTACITHTTG